MATIFINYRRQDSAGKTFALRQALLKYFSEAELFLDVKGLEGGVEFDVALEKTVAAADVMVVVIGPDWLTLAGPDGNPRIHNENDYVRSEIAGALALGKPVLPVLLEDTKMPAAEALPDDLRKLVRHNARTLRLDRMNDDAKEIARTLKRMIRSADGTPWHWIAGAAAAAFVVGVWFGPFFHEWTELDWAPPADTRADLAEARSTIRAQGSQIADKEKTIESMRDAREVHKATIARLQAETGSGEERRSELARQIAELKAVQASAVDALKTDHQTELANLKESQKQERGEYAARFEALMEGHSDAIDALKTNHASELADHKSDIEKQRRQNGLHQDRWNATCASLPSVPDPASVPAVLTFYCQNPVAQVLD